jgi:hypothetical protein
MLIVCSSLISSACQDDPPPTPAAPPTTSAAPSASASDTTALKAAGPKATAPTEEAELGTLPDGVGLPVGSKAPDFELPGLDGTTSLESLLSKSQVLLVFYRGGW